MCHFYNQKKKKKKKPHDIGEWTSLDGVMKDTSSGRMTAEQGAGWEAEPRVGGGRLVGPGAGPGDNSGPGHLEARRGLWTAARRGRTPGL